ncbi:MAG: hypothetical protein HC764_21075 [Pleurocapsa sp. CRU_1_2]|nr:hypothetical protein [Pleurocapsa sp. CRU_1_2]
MSKKVFKRDVILDNEPQEIINIDMILAKLEARQEHMDRLDASLSKLEEEQKEVAARILKL